MSLNGGGELGEGLLREWGCPRSSPGVHSLTSLQVALLRSLCTYLVLPLRPVPHFAATALGRSEDLFRSTRGPATSTT